MHSIFAAIALLPIVSQVVVATNHCSESVITVTVTENSCGTGTPSLEVPSLETPSSPPEYSPYVPVDVPSETPELEEPEITPSGGEIYPESSTPTADPYPTPSPTTYGYYPVFNATSSEDCASGHKPSYTPTGGSPVDCEHGPYPTGGTAGVPYPSGACNTTYHSPPSPPANSAPNTTVVLSTGVGGGATPTENLPASSTANPDTFTGAAAPLQLWPQWSMGWVGVAIAGMGAMV